MTRPNITIIDVDSNTEITREMNDEEYASFLKVSNVEGVIE